jgi:ubiquinone/menaquinone biosynthesis C-methylase UbiE
MKVHEAIEEHYNLGQESSRLKGPSLERLRTESILRRYLPAPPATVLDIGGGDGVYAFSLSERGYRIHLVDPMHIHVEQAEKRNRQSPSPLQSISVGDARQLAFDNESADAVLFLGPLYHLTSKADRLLALGEARRVLRPGGILVAAFISKFTSFIDGTRCGYFSDPVFRGIVREDLKTGHHTNPFSHPAYFAEAFFHHPGQAKGEVVESGFEDCKLISIEGPIWMINETPKQLADHEISAELLAILEKVELDETLVGASGHFGVIARK